MPGRQGEKRLILVPGFWGGFGGGEGVAVDKVQRHILMRATEKRKGRPESSEVNPELPVSARLALPLKAPVFQVELECSVQTIGLWGCF